MKVIELEVISSLFNTEENPTLIIIISCMVYKVIFIRKREIILL